MFEKTYTLEWKIQYTEHNSFGKELCDSRMNHAKQLTSTSETSLFIILLVFSILTYIFLFFSVIGIVIIALLWLISFFSHGLFLGQIRSNGVKITDSQYPQIHQKVCDLCKEMNIIKIPSVYVVESAGILNAFATRLLGRNFVVLYSDIFELIEEGAEDEVTFILAHELAHIKRNHILKQILLLPGNVVPFLGSAYSRACEYTCDRMGAYFIENGERAGNGLMILAVGKRLYQSVNKDAYIVQLQTERSFFVWLSELLSTHPSLPKRIAAVETFMNMREETHFPAPRKKIVILSLIIFLFFVGGVGSAVVASEVIIPSLSSVFEEESVFDDGEVTDITPLMEAIMSEGEVEFQSLISTVNLEATDADGWNALHYAAEYPEDEKMLETLLELGMNPDIKDDYGMTPLMVASQNGFVSKVELLLGAGADPNLEDQEGWTPLIYTAYMEPTNRYNLYKVLLAAGGDPLKKDEAGYTAIDYARDAGNEADVKLLSQ
ncbi:M48 family metallopeptidase [Pseudalkalibacillus hwajinpoensis]|uniref:M48 family metallopeptidase n=1 Tax=Guptibacillus hwajinpoensis TaxID=208199 RepID=UPI001CD2164E|nr:M48 family metallopeptidase [Pseudalkalibacillus hwajinpoensis]MCA0989852.1 M48 family metallopeptidase [Pseudalkalibacillus hwajinpoensis]